MERAPTPEEIVAALDQARYWAPYWLERHPYSIERTSREADILLWLADRVGEGQEARESSGFIDLQDRDSAEGRPVFVIPLDGGKPTTADEILAKMKPLPQAPDDGGKQT